MEKKDLELYEAQIAQLSEQEKIKRNIYLRKLQTGEIQGPPTGYKSIDKPWLKYYSEEALSINYPRKSLYEYMMNKNLDHLDDVALCYFGTKLTYREFVKKIDKTVRSYKKLGVKRGDIVTICMPNVPEAVIAFYALNKMGAVANMIHPLSAENEIMNYLNEVNSNVILTIDIAADKVSNIINKTSVKNVIVASPADSLPPVLKFLYKFKNKKFKSNDKRFMDWDHFMNLSANDHNEVYAEPYKQNKLAVILHTGGTTGNPKGVKLSDDNFNTMVEQFFKNEDNFERGDRMLTIMPVFHGFGLCSSIHLPLSVGVNINLIPKLEKKDLYKLIVKDKVNHLIGVPTLYKAILNSKDFENADLSNLRYVVSGGDLVKDSLETEINHFLEQHQSKAKLCKGFGLSEMVAGATFACNDYNDFNSIGIPMVDTDFKIVKSGTDEEVVGNEIGEMCFRGPSVMMGYYNNQKETDEALRNGWLHTGDLGKFEGDLLYFVQRKGNMIISSGVNVYPSNIEEVIEMHDSVQNCVVVGVHHPYKMEVPKAFIILKEGCEVTDGLKQEISELCKKNLNVYSQPYDYEFVEKLPETLLGKVDRVKIQEKEQGKTLSLKKGN